MSFTGDTTTLKRFSKSLREISTVTAQKIATAAAPVLTTLLRATFDTSEDPYGVPWDSGRDGQTITLRKTGALASGLSFVAIGVLLRMRLAARHAKYQVGRRPVSPRQGEPLPLAWREALARTARDVLTAEVRR